MEESGPWSKVLEESLDDSRQQQDPLPVHVFPLERKAKDLPRQDYNLEERFVAQFLKFDLLDWYRSGGGLQYLDIQNEKGSRLTGLGSLAKPG